MIIIMVGVKGTWNVYAKAVMVCVCAGHFVDFRLN